MSMEIIRFIDGNMRAGFGGRPESGGRAGFCSTQSLVR